MYVNTNRTCPGCIRDNTLLLGGTKVSSIERLLFTWTFCTSFEIMICYAIGMGLESVAILYLFSSSLLLSPLPSSLFLSSSLLSPPLSSLISSLLLSFLLPSHLSSPPNPPPPPHPSPHLTSPHLTSRPLCFPFPSLFPLTASFPSRLSPPFSPLSSSLSSLLLSPLPSPLPSPPFSSSLLSSLLSPPLPLLFPPPLPLPVSPSLFIYTLVLDTWRVDQTLSTDIRIPLVTQKNIWQLTKYLMLLPMLSDIDIRDCVVD